ncbi:DUF2586 family protein [Salmonella enterica subsp. enterica serovar Typhimurium]|nr:DUF2586 family protein [Salmonella enterica subsp. enterica serovar Typhimurium]ECM2733798.1 DUF2586 family protein [Salmonella enterica subsp. enterica serovar Typhimurium]
MTWPTVTVNQVNQLLGETNEVERTLLFIGTGTKNVGKTLAVNAQSDFNALLGEGNSPLKSDVLAAMANAGQNWWGFVHVLAADSEPGVLAGRLCNRAVTVADSPARVKTGALLNLGSDELPEDGTGKTLELATLKALEAQRYSVPMWYPDYDGFYWADGRTLDVEGGDYQSIETLRIVDKAARRVRLLAIGKIADRSLNSTPGSIAAHQTLFARPLREMSTAANINGVSFPGEVKPPQDGDVSIVWKSKKAVDIYIVVRTYEVPLQITISLLLDASLEAAA